ncbi:MAG TPA: pyridoxamine 5'-phosphate oxidase family protein [Acidimicrobiales bacterium]|nr:pyridoxamine 5'-phosphate oxidase family protein [Acidimicrobiales bacterium]
MPDANYDDLAEEFFRRVAGIAWAVVATVDTAGRPRTRVLHPVWEPPGPTAFIGTRPTSLKAKHLERTPFVSLTYWTPEQAVAAAECRVEWVADDAERARVWDLIKATPEPHGYDPGTLWSGPGDPQFGVLRLDAYQLELSGGPEIATGVIRRTWRDSATER